MPAPERASRSYRVVARVLRVLMLATTRRRWIGAEHLRQDHGLVVVANHVTMVDPLTFLHFLYDNGLAPRILAKASLFRVPVLGAIMRRAGQIPVDRRSGHAGESLLAAVRAVEAGECVAVFPEGTLTRDPDLWPMTGRTGVARLALATRAPVVPVAQWGAHRLLAPYGKVPRPLPRAEVTVVAGPPVELSDLYDRPLDGEVLREATERVMAAVTALLEGVRGETAPAERFDPRKRPEVTGDLPGDLPDGLPGELPGDPPDDVPDDVPGPGRA